MNIDTIIETRQQLDKELRLALSTMEKKDTIQKIKMKIINNQKACPHFDHNYNWSIVDNTCPYCGMHFANNNLWREDINDKGY